MFEERSDKHNSNQYNFDNDLFKLFLSLKEEYFSFLWALSKLKDYKKENFYGEGKITILSKENGKNKKNKNIFLLHGYGMNEGMNILGKKLAEKGYKIYSLTLPFLKPIEKQADIAKNYLIEISKNYKYDEFAILGYSMGGLIGEWILLNTDIEISTFISLASPLKGTLTAYLGIGKSARDMRPGSEFIKKMEKIRKEKEKSIKTNIFSIITTYDLLVVPAESALNENAINIIIPKTSHIGAIRNDIVSECVDWILTYPYSFFKEHTEYRKFSPSLYSRIFEKIYEEIKKITESKENLEKNLENENMENIENIENKKNEFKIKINKIFYKTLEKILDEAWKKYFDLTNNKEYYILSYPYLKELLDNLNLNKIENTTKNKIKKDIKKENLEIQLGISF